MDDETAALVCSIQIQDIRVTLQCNKGKGREGELNDEQVALRLQIEELRGGLDILSDKRMTRSISQAVQDDAPVLSILRGEEIRAKHDREMACRLAGVDVHTSLTDFNVSENLTEDLVARLSSLNVADEDDNESCFNETLVGYTDSDAGEASSSAVQRLGQHRDLPKIECIVCLESKLAHDGVRSSCNHFYCRKCITKLFENSLVDETLFPARCCRREIPISQLARPIAHTVLSPGAQLSFYPTQSKAMLPFAICVRPGRAQYVNVLSTEETARKTLTYKRPCRQLKRKAGSGANSAVLWSSFAQAVTI
ncbi:MAG: hypothetical protein M4579_005846 [Chaenotheca gracillima]|nr:MAG: hypothetical protein M4579_005846 [Chaenotheca gracillima]